jgi:2,3-dihydroxy-p-cumate/2,3-dihydroxybenzoate 3,4-dioxygenase
MIRYDRLDRVDLNVTDLERSVRFYEEIVGLQRVGTTPGGALTFRCGTDRCEVVLHRSPMPGFRAIGLALQSAAALDELHEQLAAHGVACEELTDDECGQRRLLGALLIAEPNTGATFEFYVPRRDPLAQDSPAFVPSVAQIQRIGHVVFTTPSYAETLAFMRGVLGFATSDDIAGVITFMRPPPNPYHHGVGVARGARHGLHHVNFMVSEIDDIGVALNRFRRHDVPVVFGPGRHIASNSVFLYFLDPDGLTLEYSFGMEEFPETGPRPPRTLPPAPESIDSWGGRPDPRLGATGLVQPHRAGARHADPGRPA